MVIKKVKLLYRYSFNILVKVNRGRVVPVVHQQMPN
jgi:hypothetical protein